MGRGSRLPVLATWLVSASRSSWFRGRFCRIRRAPEQQLEGLGLRRGGEHARDKLKQLQDLLAHQIPNGDPAAIVERALDALLIQVHKRKTGIAAKPRAKARSESPPMATDRRTRSLEVAARREVWTRDQGRCGFVGEGGRRCEETRGLEFAHIHPWAKGGADTATNLGLRCIAHNAWEADRDYGTSHVASKRKPKLLKLREPTLAPAYAVRPSSRTLKPTSELADVRARRELS